MLYLFCPPTSHWLFLLYLLLFFHLLSQTEFVPKYSSHNSASGPLYWLFPSAWTLFHQKCVWITLSSHTCTHITPSHSDLSGPLHYKFQHPFPLPHWSRFTQCLFINLSPTNINCTQLILVSYRTRRKKKLVIHEMVNVKFYIS